MNQMEHLYQRNYVIQNLNIKNTKVNLKLKVKKYDGRLLTYFSDFRYIKCNVHVLIVSPM